MADAMKLLPCPFCGEDAQVSRRMGYAFSFCGKCHAEGPTSREDADHAAKAWNRRASPPAREEAPAEGALIGQIEALLAIQNPSHPLPGLARQLLNRAVTALRNRTSEPEAREGGGGGLCDCLPRGKARAGVR